MSDGNSGTPDAGCAGSSCLQSNPAIAEFEHALVITTEQSVFGAPGSTFYGANVYALDKKALIGGAPSTNTALVLTYPQNGDPLRFLVPAQQVGHCILRNTFLMGTTATALAAEPAVTQHT